MLTPFRISTTSSPLAFTTTLPFVRVPESSYTPLRLMSTYPPSACAPAPSTEASAPLKVILVVPVSLTSCTGDVASGMALSSKRILYVELSAGVSSSRFATGLFPPGLSPLVLPPLSPFMTRYTARIMMTAKSSIAISAFKLLFFLFLPPLDFIILLLSSYKNIERSFPKISD